MIRLTIFVAMIAGTTIAGAAEPDGKQLFLKGAVPACALCHTLKDAGATGMIGPVLDEIKPDAMRVAKAIRSGLGQMPPNAALSDAEVESIAKYVAKASGAGE